MTLRIEDALPDNDVNSVEPTLNIIEPPKQLSRLLSQIASALIFGLRVRVIAHEQ